MVPRMLRVHRVARIESVVRMLRERLKDYHNNNATEKSKDL